MVTEYWYVFCEYGFRRPVWVFLFQFDTFKYALICCKPPRYGPPDHEVMRKLVESLYENGVMEEYDGPWEALVVLSGKSHQENVPWHKYQWRLCVSYQKMNQITHPFTFSVSRCDDAVQYIETEAKYFIAVDMDSGYWQVVA